MKVKKVVTTKYVEEESGLEFKFEPIEDTISLKPILSQSEEDEKKGYAYVLKYLSRDENPSSPDEWGNTDLFLVHYHRQFWVERKEMSEEQLMQVYKDGDGETKDYWIFPVSAYIHSGVGLSLKDSFLMDSEGWDTSHVGAVCASKKEWKTREEALKAAESLLTEWNQYLDGKVYCCVREHLDANKESVDYDIVGGFYGEEYAKECLENDDF